MIEGSRAAHATMDVSGPHLTLWCGEVRCVVFAGVFPCVEDSCEELVGRSQGGLLVFSSLSPSCRSRHGRGGAR